MLLVLAVIGAFLAGMVLAFILGAVLSTPAAPSYAETEKRSRVNPARFPS